MAGAVLLTCLCLSVRVASGHGETDLQGPQERLINPTVTVEIEEKEQQSVNTSSTKLAALGLAELLPRMTLFSYALNLSIAQCGGSGDCLRDQKVNEGLVELVQRMTLFSHALNSSGGQFEGDGEQVNEALAELVQRMALFSYSLNTSTAQHKEDDGDQRVNKALVELMQRMTLFSYALNTSAAQPEGGSDGEQRVNEALAELVHAMTLLSEALTSDHHTLLQSTATPLPLPSSPASTTSAPGQQPCLPPFELIAYRMCILQEMELKLSWSDAQEFCRERGAELAQDMTVIKTRRFLNDLYGEDGTRSRWPIWVGGRKVEQTWKWTGGLDVPEFLWASKEPRPYSKDLMPEGVCLFLDGYRRFHGASLPCHLRRRFVCQLRD